MGYTLKLKATKTVEEAKKPSNGGTFGIADNRETAAIHQSLQNAATLGTEAVQMKGPLTTDKKNKKRARDQDNEYIADDEFTDEETKKPKEKKRKLNEGADADNGASQAAVVPDEILQEDETSKADVGLNRFKRLRGRRGTERRKDLPTLGKAQPKGTAYGTTSISRQPFHYDPRITTNMNNYGGKGVFKTPFPSTYSGWAENLKSENWRHISQNIHERAPIEHGLDEHKRRSAASIVATTQEAEIYRDPVADKIARSAINKMAVDENTKAFPAYFGMAGKGRARYYKQISDGTRQPTAEDLKVFEDMSASSGEEDSDDGRMQVDEEKKDS